jgi:hypothetical protein
MCACCMSILILNYYLWPLEFQALGTKNAALGREIGSKFPQAGYKCEYMAEDLLMSRQLNRRLSSGSVPGYVLQL